MDVVRRKQLTQRALIDLEEVVLDVLHEARQDNGGLQPVEIGKLIGIPLSSQRLPHIAAPIVRGILARLEWGGLVRQKESYGPWELTNKGIETQLSKYDANVR